MKKYLLSFLCLMMALTMLLSAAGCAEKKDEPVVTTHLLRIGILSDIHINADTRYSMYDRLEKALMFYKQKGVDGILIAGDLQDKYDLDSGIAAMEELADIWQRIFPNNINDLTGEYVEPMFVYGNHDEAMVEAQYWPEGFGSEYGDAWIKEIKGYKFVGVHYTRESDTLVQKLLDEAAKASTDKPFFFTQHVPMADTIIGGYTSYDGNAISKQESIMRSYNCLVFTGHTHIPVTDERTIWQSTSKKAAQYTVVSCGTLHYSHLGDFSKLEINGDEHQTQQGMYMIVDGSQITLERYSFTDLDIQYQDGTAYINETDVKTIGAPWSYDAMDKKDRPYTYEVRERDAYEPVFPEGAALEVTELTGDCVTLTIPAAAVTAPEGFSDLVQSYYVEVADASTGEIIKTVEIAAPYHLDSESEHLNHPVTMKLTGLEAGREYTLYAYARECYQKASEPLTITVITPEG